MGTYKYFMLPTIRHPEQGKTVETVERSVVAKVGGSRWERHE